jgi:hypothetical protein
MNNIIEKLGITPGPWKLRFCKNSTPPDIIDVDGSCIDSGLGKITKNVVLANLRIMSAAPEMLEALIKSEVMDEALYGGNDFDNQKLIEKATGKSWEEIRRLLDE